MNPTNETVNTMKSGKLFVLGMIALLVFIIGIFAIMIYLISQDNNKSSLYGYTFSVPTYTLESDTSLSTSSSDATSTAFGAIQNINENSITFLKYKIITEKDSNYLTLCGGEVCPNGYYFDNSNPVTLNYRVDSSTSVKVIRKASLDCGFDDVLSYSSINLSDFVNSTCKYSGNESSSYFDITVLDGRVTEISEHYLP